MGEMIESRRKSEKKEERYDLLSSLMDANDDSADGLTDQELLGMCILRFPLPCDLTIYLGNIFVFLIAGTCCFNVLACPY